MPAYIIDIEMFQTFVSSDVEHYKNCYHFGIRETTWFVSVLFFVVNGMFFHSFIKKYVELTLLLIDKRWAETNFHNARLILFVNS